MASVSWASLEIEPYDIAPVAKRLTISLTGSTSSIGTGGAHAVTEGEQAAQCRQSPRLIVDQPRVFLVDVVALGTRGVLELEDGLRIEQVVFAFASPLVLAAQVEVAVGALRRAAPGRRPGGGARPRRRSASRPMPSEPRDGAGEVLVDQLLRTGRSPRTPGRRVYDATVEMPILDITFRTPLPAALTYFLIASCGSMPPRPYMLLRDQVFDRSRRPGTG